MTFTSNNAQEKREGPKGSLGKVAEIDEDGDASIGFGGLDARQWVLKSNFGNISVLSQQNVLKERAMSWWRCSLRRRRPPITSAWPPRTTASGMFLNPKP